MGNEKIEQLEKLLLELRSEIGAPFIVIPEYMGDGTFLAVYDKDGNAPIFKKGAANLKCCLDAWLAFHENPA